MFPGVNKPFSASQKIVFGTHNVLLHPGESFFQPKYIDTCIQNIFQIVDIHATIPLWARAPGGTGNNYMLPALLVIQGCYKIYTNNNFFV
jgi:hypothetical protein